MIQPAVAGVQARGFVLAAAAAYALGTGVLIIRKPGKLPRPVLREDYALEALDGRAALPEREVRSLVVIGP